MAKTPFDTAKKGSPVQKTYAPGGNRASKKPARVGYGTSGHGKTKALSGSRGTPLHKGKLGK